LFFSSSRRHTRCLSDWSSDVCSSDLLIFLAEAGGDTDTNAAVAGALLGARDAEAAIPPRWLEQLGTARGVATLAEQLITAANLRSEERRVGKEGRGGGGAGGVTGDWE